MSERTPEQEALALGWRPKDDWKGPEDAWKDAETFLKDGERMAGFVKKKLENEKLLLSQDFEERFRNLERTTEKALEFQQKQAEKERADLLAELNAQKSAAIEDNDLAKLEKVREQIAEVKERPPEVKPEELQAAKDFRKKHEFWQDKDWVVQNFADGAAGRLAARGLPPTEFFAELDKQIREAFPEKFGKPRARAAVESDSPAAPQGDEKTFEDLPKEAKNAYQMLAKRIKNFSKEQYAKDYYAQP